jgi:benzodiazapine receptor
MLKAGIIIKYIVENGFMNSAKMWRWIALVSVIVNIGFNYIYVSDGTMSTISDTYRTVFRPAGYAFSIWGIIYLTWIAFCVYELLPGQIANRSHESLSKPVIVSSLLSIGWIVSFTGDNIGLSMLLIAAMLVVAILQFRNANRVVTGSSSNKWLVLLPFSLYAGWLSVATIANAFIWVNFMGWAGTAAVEQYWGIALVVVAGIAGTAIALQYRNPFFPLVIAWASLALWVEQGNQFRIFGNVSLVVCLVMLALGIFNFSRRWPERKVVL